MTRLGTPPPSTPPPQMAPLFEDADLPRLWREEEARGRDERHRRYDPYPADYGPAPDFVQDRFRRDPPPQPSPGPASSQEEPDPPPAEAAERVAAGRAALAGRYDDAQKLARLAESLRKIAVVPGAMTEKAAPAEEEDGWNQKVEPMDRPLNCTART